MIEKTAILYPSVVMAILSICMIYALGGRRLMAVRGRKLSIKYYRTYDQGEGEPESLRQHSRHVQNHFEVPPLFHLVVWGTFLAGEVTTFAVAAAWVFVGARCLHSAIHLGYNNINHRFFVYGFSLLVVLVLWVRLLFTLGG